MSNRVRILFHCSLEGPVAHLGNKALKRLQHYVDESGQSPQASDTQWIAARRHRRMDPLRTVLDTRTRVVEGVLEDQVLVQVSIPDTPRPKPTDALLTRCKWYWQHLPQEVKMHSRLIVTRESRNASWKYSKANPWQLGIKSPKQLAVEGAKLRTVAYEKTAADALFGNGLLQAAGAVLAGEPPAAVPAAAPAGNREVARARWKTKPPKRTYGSGLSYHRTADGSLEAHLKESLLEGPPDDEPSPWASPDDEFRIERKTRGNKKPSAGRAVDGKDKKPEKPEPPRLGVWA